MVQVKRKNNKGCQSKISTLCLLLTVLALSGLMLFAGNLLVLLPPTDETATSISTSNVVVATIPPPPPHSKLPPPPFLNPKLRQIRATDSTKVDDVSDASERQIVQEQVPGSLKSSVSSSIQQQGQLKSVSATTTTTSSSSPVGKETKKEGKELISSASTQHKKQKQQQQHERKPKEQQQNDKESNIHIIFSTTCSEMQNWQSYLFFYQAMIHIKQGTTTTTTVTRIASGCTTEERKNVQKQHDEQIQTKMNDNFLIHFTPKFWQGGDMEGSKWHKTKYWNKPFGVKHWLETILGYKYEDDLSTTQHDDDIIVLVDPDTTLQRNIVNDFSYLTSDMWSSYAQNRSKHIYTKVTHGKPIAQIYDFDIDWYDAGRKNLTYVVGPNSPVHKFHRDKDREFLEGVYPAGPPYILTARDMYRISYHWVDILPRLFETNGVFMDEMHAYSMAAAHIELPHQLATGLMISNIPVTNLEGWQFLKDATVETACDVSKYMDTVPMILHYCQRYSIGDYFFNKYLIPENILSCEHPLLEPPPIDIASKTNISRYGNGYVKDWRYRIFNNKLRNTYMICSIIKTFNEALTYYKDNHCDRSSSTTNYEKTYNMLDEIDIKNNKQPSRQATTTKTENK